MRSVEGLPTNTTILLGEEEMVLNPRYSSSPFRPSGRLRIQAASRLVIRCRARELDSNEAPDSQES
jgi:hypothetical protein